METATSSTYRSHLSGPTPQTLSTGTASSPSGPIADAPGPAAQPTAVRHQTLPPEGPKSGGTDIEKVAKNAAANATALGSCFGTMLALNNAVRATPGMPTAVKAFTGLLPSAGVFLTPWVEEGVRKALDTTATYPVQPSLAHDAVAGATLFLFNRACARSARIPKFPAATPAGMAATVLQATTASVLAGGFSELTAQWMNVGETGEAPANIDNTRKGTGRLLSQAPSAALQTALALGGRPLPPSLALLPMGVTTGGWCFRRVLIPPA